MKSLQYSLDKLKSIGLDESSVFQIIGNKKILTLLRDVRDRVFSHNIEPQLDRIEDFYLSDIRKELEALRLSFDFNSFNDEDLYSKILTPLDEYILDKNQ